jgi:hypothetical protein
MEVLNMARRGNRDNDGKYLRLTGLWPSKKNDALWTGKFRNEDIGKLLEKVEQADKDGADLVFFLWENTEKNGKKDPDFTVQVSVSEDEGGSRGRSSRNRGGSSRGRDRDEEREETEENNDNDNNEEDNEKEEKPSRPSSRSEKKDEPKGRRTSTSKKDKNDW